MTLARAIGSSSRSTGVTRGACSATDGADAPVQVERTSRGHPSHGDRADERLAGFVPHPVTGIGRFSTMSSTHGRPGDGQRCAPAQSLSGVAQHILGGRTSRAALAAECGLSVASVTNLVSELISEGLVMEAGSVASSGGRPVTLLAPNPDGAYFLGADVGERGVAVELFDLSMTRIDREFRGGSEGEQLDAISRRPRRGGRRAEGAKPGVWDRIVGLGLGLPGIVETRLRRIDRRSTPRAWGGHRCRCATW